MLTEIEKAVLVKVYGILDRKTKFHQEKEDLLKGFPSNMRGMANKAFDKIVNKGLLRRGSSHGKWTYYPTKEGADIAEKLEKELTFEERIKWLEKKENFK